MPDRPAMLVRTATVETMSFALAVVLTGEIKPRLQSDLSFRVSGRIVERSVEIGSHVTADQVLARIDPHEQEANVASAEAAVAAAEASLKQASATFERQKTLLERGFTTRRDFDQAEETLRKAKGSLEGAKAQLAVARDQLSYTTLRAGVAGIVTARSGEVGEVVQAAHPVFTIAADGPVDAVFRVPESLLGSEPPSKTVSIALVSDPSVRTQGIVREVAPTVDAAAGTITVKVALDPVPVAMTLGAAVTGRGHLPSKPGVVLPWTSVTSDDGKTAVWIVDPATETVSLKPITVDHYGTGLVVVSGGLAAGETVVTSGGQLLHPGQRISLASGEPQ
jgi:RND family efflux transporter MFP subunit